MPPKTVKRLSYKTLVFVFALHIECWTFSAGQIFLQFWDDCFAHCISSPVQINFQMANHVKLNLVDVLWSDKDSFTAMTFIFKRADWDCSCDKMTLMQIKLSCYHWFCYERLTTMKKIPIFPGLQSLTNILWIAIAVEGWLQLRLHGTI